ncbi:Long-chain-alcohol oxidase FAO1-like protein [Drosera capensis]
MPAAAAAADSKKRLQCHPLLRGGRRQTSSSSEKGGYSRYGFSSSQIESLSVICETLIPSVPLQSLQVDIYSSSHDLDALEEFASASGADHRLPLEVAEVVNEVQPVLLFITKIVLTLLATRLGTLFLCGLLCLDWRFPYIHRFPEIELKNREAILQKWSRGRSFRLSRPVFVLIKMACCFNFYTRASFLATLPASSFYFLLHDHILLQKLQ